MGPPPGRTPKGGRGGEAGLSLGNFDFAKKARVPGQWGAWASSLRKARDVLYRARFLGHSNS